MKKLNNFMGVDFILDNEKIKYICEHCGEKLATVEKRYYKQNREMATEDYPEQLSKEHKDNCKAQLAEAYRLADIAIENGVEGYRDELASEILN